MLTIRDEPNTVNMNGQTGIFLLFSQCYPSPENIVRRLPDFNKVKEGGATHNSIPWVNPGANEKTWHAEISPVLGQLAGELDMWYVYESMCVYKGYDFDRMSKPTNDSTRRAQCGS